MATRLSLSRALAIAVAAILSITTITLIPGTGAADPDLSIDEVQARVDALYEEAEVATERAHEIDLDVQDAQRHLAALRTQIAKQEREFESLREVLADMAADMYASGGVDPSMQMMLSASPEEFLSQAQSLGGEAASGARKRVRGASRRLAMSTALSTPIRDVTRRAFGPTSGCLGRYRLAPAPRRAAARAPSPAIISAAVAGSGTVAR